MWVFVKQTCGKIGEFDDLVKLWCTSPWSWIAQRLRASTGPWLALKGLGLSFTADICWILLISYVRRIEGCMLQKNEQYTPMIWYTGRSCQSDLPWFRPRLYPVPPVEAQVQTRAVRCLVVGWGSAGMLSTEHIVIWLCPKTGFTMFYPQMASHSNFDYIINDGDHLFGFVPMKRQTHTNPYLCTSICRNSCGGYDCEARRLWAIGIFSQASFNALFSCRSAWTADKLKHLKHSKIQ